MNLVSEIVLASPALILSFGAVMVLLVGTYVRRDWQHAPFAGLFLILSLLVVGWQSARYERGLTVLQGFVYADPFVMFFSFVIIAGALLSLLIGMEKLKQERIESPAEYYALLLFSASGALIMASAAELITLFIGLEIMSMALYCLCGAALSLRRSAESALKYFFLGSFSSAFLLYGIAIIYGLTGTTNIEALRWTLMEQDAYLVAIALGLVLVGLVFKIGAVPFHFWAPDVYEGAPTPVTAYMACVIKAAAVAVGLRVIWGAFGALFPDWSGAVWTIAALTMVLGNVLALKQRSLKRMLAYSSIAHAGYIMVAFLSQGGELEGGAAILYYVLAYTIMTLGAFGVVLAVTSQFAAEPHSDDISRVHGLGYSRPFLGIAMTIFLLSLAGIPPGMAGLLGKVYIFSSAVKSGYVGLAVIGVLSSVVSCYYYLRVIVAMYFVEAREGGEPVPDAEFSLKGVLAVCVVSVIALGVFPTPVYRLAASVMESF